MRKNHFKIAGAAVMALSMAMTMSACGSRDAGGGSTGGGSSEKKVAKIGVVSPLSGDLSALGTGIRNSVDLAVKQANESDAIPGWTLEVVAEDDQGQPDAGKNAATKVASDDDVVGVVGPLNSSVGQAIQPIFNSSGIVEVSPANTNPTLTKGADLSNPQRTYDNYFRTCTTDAVQGPFAAKYLLDSGIKEVATLHDKKAYGQGLVSAFSEAYTAGGGKIVAAETINPEDKNFSAVISKLGGANPKALYYGGEYPQAGPISKQMKDGGLNVPLMGGDGIYDPTFIELGGDKTAGDLATSVGAPVEDLPSAKAFVDAYNAGGYEVPYGAYGAYSYDAANAIIEGLKTSLKDAEDGKAARKDTIAAVAKVDFDGASGKVAFDEFGDSKSRVMTVYKVDGGKWVADKTEDFK